MMLARRITLPAMLGFAIPGLANLWLIATKDTALLAVVGFGDFEFVAGLEPALTSVRINGAAIGEQAARFLMARAEGHYDQRITQRLILQPRAELNFAAQDSRRLNLGSGLSDAEVGVRLRYDIRREFAPYLGVQYRRTFGDTRRLLRADGEETGGWSLVAGLRTWF